MIGRADVMDLHPAGSMTSTHTGNPVCCAAALASIEVILNENLAGERAADGRRFCTGSLQAMQAAVPADRLGGRQGAGGGCGVREAGVAGAGRGSGVGGGTASRMEKGVLMFSPVGFGGGDGQDLPAAGDQRARRLRESLGAFEEAFAEVAGAAGGCGAMTSNVLMVGGGMITHDQILPSLFQMQRLGQIGDITVVAQRRSTVESLAANETIRRAFPGQYVSSAAG